MESPTLAQLPPPVLAAVLDHLRARDLLRSLRRCTRALRQGARVALAAREAVVPRRELVWGLEGYAGGILPSSRLSRLRLLGSLLLRDLMRPFSCCRVVGPALGEHLPGRDAGDWLSAFYRAIWRRTTTAVRLQSPDRGLSGVAAEMAVLSPVLEALDVSRLRTLVLRAWNVPAPATAENLPFAPVLEFLELRRPQDHPEHGLTALEQSFPALRRLILDRPDGAGDAISIPLPSAPAAVTTVISSFFGCTFRGLALTSALGWHIPRWTVRRRPGCDGEFQHWLRVARDSNNVAPTPITVPSGHHIVGLRCDGAEIGLEEAVLQLLRSAGAGDLADSALCQAPLVARVKTLGTDAVMSEASFSPRQKPVLETAVRACGPRRLTLEGFLPDLSALGTLRRLRLWSCPEVRSLDELADVCELSLQYCGNLYSLWGPVLRHRRLEILECDGLEDLSFRGRIGRLTVAACRELTGGAAFATARTERLGRLRVLVLAPGGPRCLGRAPPGLQRIEAGHGFSTGDVPAGVAVEDWRPEKLTPS